MAISQLLLKKAPMVSLIKTNLKECESILTAIATEDFTAPIKTLSDATIGQHFRHVLEFYNCLLDGCSHKMVCYDNRKRELIMENDVNYCLRTVEAISQKIDLIKEDSKLLLKVISTKEQLLTTSIYRELNYVFDHSIHHQALIKIAIQQLNCCNINDNFGVAPSTLKYHLQCVQ